LGFDLASNPMRLEALNQARDTGKIATTQAVHLVQETGTQSGFLAFVPVYSTGSVPETVELRREALTGFALGVFSIGDILRSVMAQTPPLTKFDLYVLDTTAPRDASLLYYRGAPGQDGRSMTADELLLGGYEKTVLSVADRDWLLIFVPLTGFSIPASTMPWIVGAVGLFLSILFSLFLRITQNRTRVIGQTVLKRTFELSTANQAWLEEMAERQTADRLLQEQNEALQFIHKLTVAGTPRQSWG
jgi:CHASE1-domain containing sensor protein